MKYAQIVAGIAMVVFLVPLFMRIRDSVLLPIFEARITNEFLWLFYYSVPYVIVLVIIAAFFLVLRGRPSRD